MAGGVFHQEPEPVPQEPGREEEAPDAADEETPRGRQEGVRRQGARNIAAQSAARARQREQTWQQEVDNLYEVQQSAFASSSRVMTALEHLLKRGEGDQVVRHTLEAINSMLQVKT